MFSSLTLTQAQEVEQIEVQKEDQKTWEFGLGGDLLNISRMTFHNYSSKEAGDAYSLKLRNVMFGADLYVARELSRWFYLDLQANAGMVKILGADDMTKHRWFALAGLGLQWRLTPFFKKEYVEPYFRAGLNYMFKDFDLVRYGSVSNYRNDFLTWTHSDYFNKKQHSERHLFLPSLGFGVNSWFNDRVGFGIQGDYLMSVGSKERLAFPQAIARVMIRMGRTKAEAPQFVYRDQIVHQPVPVEVVKYVEKDCDPLYLLFSNITFPFDSYELTPESHAVLDDIAKILLMMTDKKFLITGYTDARGTAEYNRALSADRAAAVVKALEERGIPTDMLKSRGVGKKVAMIPVGESHEVREGDRKVSIELIVRMPYWNKLPKTSY